MSQDQENFELIEENNYEAAVIALEQVEEAPK